MKRDEIKMCLSVISKKFQFGKSRGNDLLYRIDVKQTWASLDSPESSKHFMELVYQTTGYIPSQKEILELKAVIGQAIELKMIPLAATDIPSGIRVIGEGNEIYIDLGSKILKVSEDGYKCVKGLKIAFKRHAKQLPLPLPDGAPEVFEFFLKLGLTEEQANLVVFFMLATLNPSPPYLCLVVIGPAGSGKTTLVKVIKTITDPEEATTIPMPNNCRNLRVAAASRHLLSIDNCSDVKARQEDELCTIITGTSVVERKLYSNFDTDQRKYCCPVIVSSIAQFSSRNDLQDRMLVLELDRPDKMMSSQEIEAMLKDYLPRIVKWFAEALAAICANKDSETVESKSRLIDSIRFVSKAASYMNKDKDFFVNLVEENQKRVRLDHASTSPLIREIDSLIMSHAYKTDDPERWIIEDEPTEMFERLMKHASSSSKQDTAMPRTPSAFGKKLNYIKETLKSRGIVFNSWHTGKIRLVSFQFTKSRRAKVEKMKERHSTMLGKPNSFEF